MTKIAVHLHLYYIEQLDDMLNRLVSLALYEYDLFVTLVENNSEVINKIKSFKRDAKIWIVPNVGYDIGPFIDFLQHINLDEYDYVLKLHTKNHSNNIIRLDRLYISMNMWREMMLDAILSAEGIHKVLDLFKNNSAVGMVGNKHLITDNKKNYFLLEAEALSEMKKIGLKEPQNKTFVAGTMFWVRAKLLKPFLKYNINDFSQTDGNIHDLTKAHVLERIFGWSISAQGFEIIGIEVNTFKLQMICAFFMHCIIEFTNFAYKKKLTKNGYMTVKIFKIPVIHRKVKK